MSSSLVKFYYSTMGAGKSTYALQLNYSLSKNGYKVSLAKPRIDTRDPGVIRSRIGNGLEAKCRLLENTKQDTWNYCVYLSQSGYTHVIIDESQFLSKEVIEIFFNLADYYNVEVIFLGLRTTYKGDLFEGSSILFAMADELIEIPYLGKDKRKTVAHILWVDHSPVFEGDTVHIGDTEYKSVSRKEYYATKTNTDLKRKSNNES